MTLIVVVYTIGSPNSVNPVFEVSCAAGKIITSFVRLSGVPVGWSGEGVKVCGEVVSLGVSIGKILVSVVCVCDCERVEKGVDSW